MKSSKAVIREASEIQLYNCGLNLSLLVVWSWHLQYSYGSSTGELTVLAWLSRIELNRYREDRSKPLVSDWFFNFKTTGCAGPENQPVAQAISISGRGCLKWCGHYPRTSNNWIENTSTVYLPSWGFAFMEWCWLMLLGEMKRDKYRCFFAVMHIE